MPRTRFTDIARQATVPLAGWAGLLGLPTVALADCAELPEARLEATLGGAISARIDWHGAALECDGMARPDGQGQRLRFRGPLEPGVMLTVVIGIDGLTGGNTGRELPANLTLVVEEQGLFFGSRQQDSCWADIVENTTQGGVPRVRGEVYCVRGLAALGAKASVSVSNLRFTGSPGGAADADDAREAEHAGLAPR
jgi:hypothetical protein